MLLDSNKYMNALWAAHHVHNGQHGDAGLQQHAQRGGERRAWLHCVQLPHLPPVPPLLALPRSQRHAVNVYGGRWQSVLLRGMQGRKSTHGRAAGQRAHLLRAVVLAPHQVAVAGPGPQRQRPYRQP